MAFTVVVCTHDRASSLERTLDALLAAQAPSEAVDILVIVNACSDGTTGMLQRRFGGHTRHALRWLEEPVPGKSSALNCAIAALHAETAVFVDDDQRVAEDFLVNMERALAAYPDAGIICGRLVPDWDGSEPYWVHLEGPYRIYPPPIANFDAGDTPRHLSMTDILPPGGDIAVRRDVLARVGSFATDLGPHGHDLLGGEDIDYIRRALALGIAVQYDPRIVQYHAVDHERLRLYQLLRKTYQRTRSSIQIGDSPPQGVPGYMWKKSVIYLWHAIFAWDRDKRRFYMVRLAAALGEIHGAVIRGRMS